MRLETFAGLIGRIVRTFNHSRFDYMFTGALAASYYGRPRTTLDVDIVIGADEADLSELTRLLRRAGLRVEKRKLDSAWKSNYRIATFQDKKSPHTVDVIVSPQKLERVSGRIAGLRAYYESPESLILAKLRMLRVTIQQERAATDRSDIISILNNTRIDLRSLRRKAKAQRTAEALDTLIKRSRRRKQSRQKEA